MADTRKTAFVALTAGLGTDTDPRLRAPERLEIARNVHMPELGTIAKRPGFTQLTKLIAGGGGAGIGGNGPVRCLGATTKELLAVGHRQLFAYVPKLGGWVDRGHVSPCIGDTQEAFRATVQYEQADGDRSGSYIVQAAIRREDWGDANSRRGIEFRGKDTDGNTTFEPTVVERTEATGANTFPFAVKVASKGNGHVICWAQCTAAQLAGTGPATLSRYTYSAGTPYTAPAATTDITANMLVRSTVRMFDVVEYSTGGYLVAYIDFTTQNVVLHRYAADHSLTASSSLAGTYYAVALAEASNGDVYVLTAEDNTDGADLVELWHRTSVLVAVWGPNVMDTLGTVPKETADNLGVAEGTNVAGNIRAQCLWEVQDSSVDTSEMHSRSRDPNGTSPDTGITTYNLIPYSRPFWYRNRCYAHAGTWTKEPNDGIGFESHLLFDLDCETTRANSTVAMAAMWGVGAAPGLTTGYALGSNNNVWAMADGITYRMMCPFLAEAIKADTVGGLGNCDIRHAYDDVGLEFDAAVSVAPIHRGCAIVGGGYVGWYDGARTFELGFAKPPMIYSLTQAAGSVPDGTYNYSNLFKQIDFAGVLHRSLPSPGKEEVFGGADKNVAMVAQSLPGSRRPVNDVTCEWYRAGLDAIPRRVNRSASNVPNTVGAATLQTLTDTRPVADLYVQRYTTGGILESVAPEGARVVHVARERLWAGDFFRGDRLQYSKLVVPSSYGETVIAPELFETLGRISGDGEQIVAITSLDSTTVIFTAAAIYLVSGQGPEATGRGDDTSRLHRVSSDTGCTEFRSVVRGPDGIYFQTSRGIYMLDRSFAVSPIGEPVRPLLDSYPVVTSAVLVSSQRHVRFTVTNAAADDGRILVYDYRAGAWFEWHVKYDAGSPATVVPTGGGLANSTYYIIHDDQPYFEDSSTYYDDSTIWSESRVRTGAIQPAGPLQWMGVYQITVMAEYKDDHQFNMAIYQNHSTTAADSAEWPDATLQKLADPSRMHIKRKPGGSVSSKVEAIAVELWDSEDGSPTNGQGFELHGLAVDLELIGGSARMQSEAKQ
jgi:hypothetical protein